MHPQCSNPACTTCKTCRDPQCTSGLNCRKEPTVLNPSQILKFGEKENFRCEACLKTIQCMECNKWVPTELTNAGSRKKNISCLDCLNPPCQVPACKTCKRCRDPTCESLECQGQPKALHGKYLALFATKDKFICESCLYPACENPKCQAEMTKRTRGRRCRNSTWMEPTTKRSWKCPDCEIRDSFRKR